MKHSIPKWLVATMVLTTAVYPHGSEALAKMANPMTSKAETNVRFTDMEGLEPIFQSAIQQAVEHGWIHGDQDSRFRPMNPLSRQELAKLLTAALQLEVMPAEGSSFTDVDPDAWSLPFIEAVRKAGLMIGDEGSRFRPADSVTREELSVILVRALELQPAAVADRLVVSDKKEISQWAVGYVQRVLERGLLQAAGDFQPKDPVERLDIAEVLLRAFTSDHSFDYELQGIHNNQAWINGVAYTIADSLSALFQEENHEVLSGARITFKEGDTLLQAVKDLTITRSGKAAADGQPEFSNNLVLDGEGAAIEGKLTVAANYITLRHLKINGDLEISKKLENDFYMEDVTVSGNTVINGGDTNTVVFTNSSMQQVEVNKQGVRVEALGSTSIQNMSVSADASIIGASGVAINKITLIEGAQQVDIHASVNSLEVTTKEPLNVTGATNIKELTINSTAPVNLSSQGTVGTLSIVNPNASLTVGSNVKVDNLALPTGISGSAVIPNFSVSQMQISQINGVVNPALNAAPVQNIALPNPTIQLDGGPVTLDISGVFRDPDGDSMTYAATSRTRTVATVQVDGKSLILTPVTAGSSLIQMSASDGKATGTSRFTVYVNTAPVLEAQGIPQQVVTIGNGSQTLNLSTFFSDPDLDPLTFSVMSSDPATAGVSVSGSSLVLTPVKEGTASVTVTANDGRGGAVSGTVQVLVNRAPQVQAPIADRTGTIGYADVTVDLANVFHDPDGDSLTYEVSSQDTALADVALEGQEVRLTPKAAGLPIITVTAKDGKGGSVTDSFVLKVNRAPAAAALHNRTVTIGSAGAELDLALVFSDDDQDGLSYTVVSQDESIATAGLSGSVLSLNGVGAGKTIISVTADDGNGGRTTRTFEILVNRAPDSIQSIPNQKVTILGAKAELTLADYFRDLDGDVLTYEVSSQDPALASAAVTYGLLEIEALSAGTTTVTVTAKDGRGGEKELSFPVLANRAPEAQGSIADLIVTVGSGSESISLAGLFADADQDVITLDAVSSQAGIAGVSVTGDVLNVTALSGGMATITVTAKDSNGGAGSTAFGVTANRPPVAASLTEQILQLGGTSQYLELSELFTDPDQDTLKFTVESNSSNVASATISGSKLELQPLLEGTTAFTVTADDERGGKLSRTLQVRVNRSPTVVGTLQNQTVTIDGGPLAIDLSGAFQDPDGDSWSVEAVVQDSAKAQAAVENKTLKLTGLSAGTTIVGLMASDGKGGAAEASFALLVNQAPEADQALAGQHTTLGQGDLTVDLSQAFKDGDGDTLTLKAVSAQPNIATVQLSGSLLTIHPVAGGKATIEVSAEDGKGGKGSRTFEVEVNRSPVAGVISDQRAVLERGDKTLDLLSSFQDSDGDGLTFQAVSSDESVVKVSLNGGQLVAQPVAVGTADITVTAADGKGGSGERTFKYTIEMNQAPQVSGALSDQFVAVGKTQTVNMAGMFTDGNQDPLTYQVTSSDDTVATASLTGSVITLTGVADGISVITVTASDGLAAPVSTTFTVTASSNAAPVVVGTVPLQVIGGSIPSNQFSVKSLFQDVDGDVLTYTAQAADGNLVIATVQGDILTLAPGSGFGATTITVTANDGKGGLIHTDIQVIAAKVVHTKQIFTKLGVADVSYDLSAYFPVQNSLKVYNQIKGAMTQDGAQTLNDKVFKLVPGSLGTTGYWIVAADNTAAYVDVTVEAQQGAGVFFAEYTRGPQGRIALEFYNLNESTINYRVVGYRYNPNTGQMETMMNRDIPSMPYVNVQQVYPGTMGIVINHTFYDLMDITPVQWYHGEFDMTGNGSVNYVVCAFELIKDGQIVDVIGNKHWTPAAGAPPLPELGTLIRKKGIAKGSATFQLDGEWDIMPMTYQYLFRHTP